MDIEKLIEAVKLCGSTPKVDQCKKCTYWAGGDMSKCIPRMTEDAATALSTLQAELTHKTELVRQQSNELERRDKLLKEQEAELEQMKQLYESEKENFIDFACSGIPNLSPFCFNRHPDCVDERGWCKTEKCRGFSRKRGPEEG